MYSETAIARKQKITRACVKRMVFVSALWRGKIALVKARGKSKLQ